MVAGVPGCRSFDERLTFQGVTLTHRGYPMTEIKDHMEVIGADGVHIGTVDRVEGGRIKLTKKDGGTPHTDHHHYIELSLVADIEGQKVRLSAKGEVAVMMEEHR